MSDRLVIVGTQWGDEGKGKITDYYASRADVAVRWQGGNNAGHSIEFGGQRFALRSIPSGIFNSGTTNVIAGGTVVNPPALLEELEGLESRGVTDYLLRVSDRAAVVMPYHRMLDGAYEARLGGEKIGTTGRGIGPAYADKYARTGIRVGDLLDPDYFGKRLRAALAAKNPELEALGLEPLEFGPLYAEYLEYGRRLDRYVCDTSLLLDERLRSGDRVLFEGAQGVMLCADHGTYPFVTSSSPTAASVPLGAGIAPRWVDNVLGVCKAYTTRVGEGPFPTELSGPLADGIRERGHEYGTVTGRPRRVGWLDAVALRHARRVSGLDFLALMLFDVLSGLDTVKICTAYELDGVRMQGELFDGVRIDRIPSVVDDYARCRPVYEEFPGWKEDISGAKSLSELPEAARGYIRAVEELTGVPVAVVSVGPDRSQTIEARKIF